MATMQKVNIFSHPSTTYKMILKYLFIKYFVLILTILIFKMSPLCPSLLEYVTTEV